MVVLGMISGVSLIYWRAQRAELGGARVLAGCIGIFLVGLAGSRLGIVILDLGYYVSNWREIFSLYGTGFQGALLVGLLGALVFARYLRISFWRLGDLVAPGLILGQAIGRVGCFLNGCCYGRPTDSFLGVYLPGYGAGWAYRYPTQLMHSAANLFILAVLLGVEKRKPFEGFVFLLYAILYSTQRLLIDFLRQSDVLIAHTSRLISVTTILIAVALLGWKCVRGRKDACEERHS
jgi:phosphatidylglycerol:prolipoprotein diacylglycerol transferase